MNELASKKCVPCESGTPPLDPSIVGALLDRVGSGWRVVDNHYLEREFRFKDFKSALDFTNVIGQLAEAVGHHPDIFLAWGKVHLKIWTHKINGLTESDFIFAAKVNHMLAAAGV